MTITFSTTQQITALTLNGNTGQTIVSGASSMSAGSSATYIYRAAATSWYPMQSVPTATNTQIGVGQTWTDVKASRTYATTYTNSTGRPIQVLITAQGQSQLIGGLIMQINGTNVAQEGANASTAGYQANNLTAIIPAAATYAVTNYNSGTILYWFELR